MFSNVLDTQHSNELVTDSSRKTIVKLTLVFCGQQDCHWSPIFPANPLQAVTIWINTGVFNIYKQKPLISMTNVPWAHEHRIKQSGKNQNWTCNIHQNGNKKPKNMGMQYQTSHKHTQGRRSPKIPGSWDKVEKWKQQEAYFLSFCDHRVLLHSSEPPKCWMCPGLQSNNSLSLSQDLTAWKVLGHCK